jgi:hypothetical protein
MQQQDVELYFFYSNLLFETDNYFIPKEFDRVYISKILFAKNCTMDIIKNKIEQLRYGDREKKSIIISILTGYLR